MIKMRKIIYSSVAIALLGACSSTELQQTDAKVSFPSATLTQDKTPPVTAPNAETIELSLKQIMSDPDWIGRQPEGAYWTADGNNIAYYRKREGSPVRDIWLANETVSGNGKQAPLSELHNYEYDELISDNDMAFDAWVFQGNIFSRDKATNTVIQLTKSRQAARNIQFHNSNGVSFQRANEFYVVNASTGRQEQLFTWQFANETPVVSEPADYIAQENVELIDYLKVQRRNRQLRADSFESLETANDSLVSSVFYFDPSHRTVLASLSPNGKWAIVVTTENSPSRDDSDIMPDYIEENGRIKAQPVRQRVADAKAISHDIWLLDLSNNSKTLLEYKVLPGYNEDVLADVKRENAEARGETYTENRIPRDIGLLFDWYATEPPVKWHDNSDKVALMLEAWDNKDRWITSVDVDDKQFVTQHRMHDPAWVNYRFNEFGWFDEQETLYLLSEESGYSQLYVKPLTGSLKPVTKGNFVVENVTLTQDDAYFYFKANVKHPGIYEIYRSSTDTMALEALTDLNGMTDYVLSPNESSLLLTHSKLVMPPELYSVKLDDASGAAGEALKITSTVSDAFLSIDWVSPSIVAVPSSHTEQPIYSRVYAPTVATDEKHRAVIFNHGAGYLQNAHLGWSGYFREFMFHSFLVSQGYVVMDMDYRASMGYGREWRTAIYRQMGTPETQDLVDGVEWLVKNADVDRKRIGTYGGSYGGFMTFMALFTEPELFQAGAALRPVSDWAHYNDPYTSNILNRPDVDPIAYERSSPIYFADGLNKPLLINAPMVDDNVFFVDVVRLVQVLIEKEKEDFETAIYPVEPHGFVQPSSWLDEYRRIFKLFEENL
ncbi:S9 family peptidase [Glaciecola sp. MH2013]|uniref:S9 family peptidase n=1 Tax=Glaciecola sp. MH2013 TaxID=2785524 RepID=UPI00189E4D31|nr:prolyl oligopeptidase family serine peptidase [Glaciecola sp. MH2013]MBF7072765.1 S9 family peptidase [Glaciecola sp. MH2013]